MARSALIWFVLGGSYISSGL